MFRFFGFFCAVVFFNLTSAHAQNVLTSNQHNFILNELVQGLDHPWGLAILPNGDLLVTERDEAQLRYVRNGQLDATPVSGLPDNIATGGQGGLLDVALHPQFETNRWIYLSYSGRGREGSGTEVVRAELDGMRLINLKTIFVQQPKTSGRFHFGSRLVFAADATLFISLGDKYSFLEEAQNPDNHLGALVRVNADGTIPADNPFVGQAGKRDEIYSYGHRNAQGMALRPRDQVIWMHEHGPRGGDEVNIMNKPGANYGWPAITYGIDYSGAIISDQTHMKGMEQPVIHWSPSIAPSGMTFYQGDKFPQWQDDIFVGALRAQHLRRLELNGDQIVEQEVLLDGFARIRDVETGPDGYLYLITDAGNGKVIRLEPAN